MAYQERLSAARRAPCLTFCVAQRGAEDRISSSSTPGPACAGGLVSMTMTRR